MVRADDSRFAALRNGCLLLLLLFAVSLQAQQVSSQMLSAYVDRTDISRNDVITLTLRADASLGNTRPVFSNLNRDFDQVGGIETRSTYTSVNGDIQSWTEYRIRLRPRDTGTFTIPSFRIGSEISNPIEINVSDAPSTSGADNNEIFLRTSVSKNEAYVQEQLIYTIRIYYSIGFDQGAQLSSPQVDDAVVQQLGNDENYQEVVDGIGYNITERRFVIYPQSSGTLEIPSVIFSATVGRRGGINRVFGNRGQIRDINLSSEAHSVAIRPRPASFPGQTWLPASELVLEENWSGELDNVKVGDAVTRNVELTAHGLSSSLLPGIEYQDLPGLRFYPDQPVREDSADRNGIIGTRSEGTAIVASRAGEFELPEVRLPWWNTTTDSLEVAVLPARTIRVLPATDVNGEPVEQAPVLPGADPVSGEFEPERGATPDTGDSSLWIATTIGFAVAWLLTLFLWLGSRRQLQYVETVGVAVQGNGPSTPAAAPSPRGGERKSNADLPEAGAALRVLRSACDKGRPAEIRRAVLNWGRAYFQTGAIQTLAQLSERCRSDRLSAQSRALDAALYAGNAAEFDSAALYATVAEIHKHGVNDADAKDKYSLPPLYKPQG